MMAVVDYIGEIVAKTSEKVKPVIGTDVFYQFGHIREISDTLQSYSKTEEFRRQKYPAVFLLQDFAEQKGVQGVYSRVRLQLLIVAASNGNDRSKDRYDKVFKPVLYPIYDALMKVLSSDSRIIVPYEGLAHDKIDRPLISNALVETTKGTSNLFNDMLDAIEVRNLELNIIQNCK